MTVCINPNTPKNTFFAPPSKSIAIRALILSALSQTGACVECPEAFGDIITAAECLSALGCDIKYEKGCFFVPPINPRKNAEIHCGDSAAVLRFLLPVCAVFGCNGTFDGSNQLKKRPADGLNKILSEKGCEISSPALPFTVSGKIGGGEYTVDGVLSSQYLSGLLMALPRTEQNSVIKTSGEVNSRPYIELTLSLMERFGVKVRRGENEYSIDKNSVYTSNERISVDGDWSSAAYALCAGALRGGMKVEGIKGNSLQGDRMIMEYLKLFGAKTGENEVFESSLHACEIDARDTPDLVPALAVLACAASGQTVIKNISRLKYKESDRIKTTLAMINALGGDAYYDNALFINASSNARLCGGTVDSFYDHRIAMAAAVASVICENKVTILNAQSVKKSCPDFLGIFDLFN